MATIGFLHTSAAHLPVFEALIDELQPSTRTVSIVDEALLERARRFGPTDPAVVAALRERVGELADRGAASTICTCSTVGGVAESTGRAVGIDVVRVDRAMAELAVSAGGTIIVLAALESTITPTRELIETLARAGDTTVVITPTLVGEAWARFEVGDLTGYHSLVADAIVDAGTEADVIVLAQASMAPAADLVDVAVPVLSSPRAAVESLLGAG